MAKKIKNQPEQAQEQTFSFRMILRKPSCLKADGTFDTTKLQELIAAAKAGDQEAKVLLYEQYQGLWKSIIGEFRSNFEPSVYDYEDLQQEAAVALLVALEHWNTAAANSFSKYYTNVLRNHLTEMLRIREQIVEGNCQYHQLISLNVPSQEREAYYKISQDPEELFFQDSYPRIKKLLTPKQFFVALYHYQYCHTIKEVAKALGITTRTVDRAIVRIKDCLSKFNS